ncbi:MAG: ubiquinone/menaquinone biosynthesis methyltransferase [Anaerolineales bacterium]
MTHLQGRQRSAYVRRMFGRIAGRYDLLNRVMTGGQDVRWRRDVVRRLAPKEGGSYLDLGTGTGDLAFEIQRQAPDSVCVAADFTPEMIAVGRERQGPRQPEWIVADAQRLPFSSAAFDGLVSGFLLRNVVDLDASLSEQRRVLKSGAVWVALDTSPPPAGPLRPLIELHLHHVVPFLGRILAGDADAYTYLPDSTEGFLAPEAMLGRLAAAGFSHGAYVRRMFGTIAIYSARAG